MTASEAVTSTSALARRAGALARLGLALFLGMVAAGDALATDLSQLALPEPITGDAPTRIQVLQGLRPSKIDPSLVGAVGTVDVWVRLARPDLAEANGDNAKTRGGRLTREQRRAHLEAIGRDQDALSSAARFLGGEELGRVSRAHNAVAVRVDASRLRELASRPDVVRIRGVMHYQLALAETVPYIGAAAAQAAGKNGAGARVAVLDSGIDYTHRNLGGPGTVAAYQEAVGADGTVVNPKYFPSAKVVGGFDFVGSKWPGTAAAPQPRTEDPNPIDDGPGGGHGTHVSDILAGRSLDGKHVGVAPGAQLYALKVCSSVSSSCNGIALLKAVDFALDPDQDGTLNPVDVMNLSLGSNYGMKEDDLSEALNRASAAGVVVVAAAGNAANRPYIVSSPSIGPPVISVAQTQVPSAQAIPLVVNSPATIAGTYANTETVNWAPVDRAVTGDVAFVGRGCPAGSISPTSPADPYLADPVGKVALIDRGACAVSLKVDRATKAGATAVLIGLVAAGDAVSFSFGGGDPPFVPTLVIIQADASRIKASLALGPVNVTVSPANAIPLVGSMVSSSARGPSISYQTIKPELGAPGASVSAVFGTGTEEEGFGGTSGATPMIAGSAAILVGANARLEPAQVKAMLMNTAETRIFHQPALFPGKLAPITRIGAGEVRVDRAAGATAAAWVKKDQSAAVSFGYHAVGQTMEVEREVHVENFAKGARTFQIASSFRTAGKPANAAVEVRAPASIRVPGRGDAEFEVSIVVHPENLPDWTLNGGSRGGNGLLLDDLEVDGYLTLTSGAEKLTLPWHVLPHKAAALRAPPNARVGRPFAIRNAGAAAGRVEAFALTGTSPRIPASQLPQPGDNFAIIDLDAVGARVVGPALQIAISTFGGRAHPNYPAEFDVYIDNTGPQGLPDGDPDFILFNAENGGFGATGQNLVFVQQVKVVRDANGQNPEIVPVGQARAFFFTDADLNSSNAILIAPLAELKMTASTTFNYSVFAFDNYFTGNLTDSIEDMTFTPDRPRFEISGIPAGGIPPGGEAQVTVAATPGGADASPSQSGILLQFRDSDVRRESQAVVVRP